jgi:hypothetical protein
MRVPVIQFYGFHASAVKCLHKKNAGILFEFEFAEVIGVFVSDSRLPVLTAIFWLMIKNYV